MTSTHQVRKAHENARAEWRFAFYPPGARMRPHRHDLAHFSLVIAGAQREASRGQSVECGGKWMGFKPRNFSHENEFGPQGALLLSVNLRYASEDDDEAPDANWRLRPAAPVGREWRALTQALCLAAPCDDDVNDLTDDILAALLTEGVLLTRGSAPRWLLRARQAAQETNMSAGEIARDVGVHRVHLSRAFRQHFGVTLSEERRLGRLARVAREILINRSLLASAAFAAGYADQAHMTRQVRAETGLSPGRLAKIF